MHAIWHIVAVLCFCTASLCHGQTERDLPVRGSSSLEGTRFIVGFMQNEILEVEDDPRLQIFVSAQFDATVTISSPIVGTYTKLVKANTVLVETIRTDHVNTTSEVVQQKSVFITSDVPIVVYTLNTLMQSTDSYAAIPVKHLGTEYVTVNRATDRYNGSQYENQLARVGEFMIMAVEDNTVVTINTTVPTARRQRVINVTLQKGDSYLVQAQSTAIGADDLTGSRITASKPVAVISGHVRSSVPSVTANSKDHLVEQLPSVDKWGKSYATAPMLKKATNANPDAYRIVASRPNQVIHVELQNRSFMCIASNGVWFDTLLREPAYWYSDEPFMLVQFMPSGGTSMQYYDPAMLIIPPIERSVESALFQFPTLEKNDLFINQQFYYFLNIIAEPAALQRLRIDTTKVLDRWPAMAQQTIPGTDLHWAQVELSEGSHVIIADSGLFSAVMYGTSIADSYANMVGVAYEPQRKRDRTPPAYALNVDCLTVFGEIRDRSADTARLKDVYVVSAQTRNYRYTITPVADSEQVVLFEAAVQDPNRDAQLVIHAYDDRGNGREWRYIYDAPSLNMERIVTIKRMGSSTSCTTVVVKNVDTSAVLLSSVYIVGDPRFTVTPTVRDTMLASRDSIVFRICIPGVADSSAVRAVLRIQMPCTYKTVDVISQQGSMLQGSEVDFGDVRIGDTVCRPLSITNPGAVSVVLTAFMLEKLANGLVLDTSGLRLPRTMKPGDQVWVRACFVPADTGIAAKTDTVLSQDAGTALLSAKGRGVRPLIQQITVDWGRRRIGSQHDTTVYLLNSGSAQAKVASTLSGFTMPFSALQQDLTSRIVAPNDSIPLRFRFAPQQRDQTADTEAVAVDWRFHEPVSIVLLGSGVLPDIELADVDMGRIQLGRQRDSLVQFVGIGASGNAPLIVESTRVLGPDSSAFFLPTTLTGLANTNIVQDIVDNLTFRPVRLGAHLCQIEVVHNAGINVPVRDTFNIVGIGVAPDSAIVELGLDAEIDLVRCVDSELEVTIGNRGTIGIVINDVRLVFGADTVDLVTVSNAFWLDRDSMYMFRYPYSTDRVGLNTIELHVQDSAGNRYSKMLSINVRDLRASIMHGWDSLPPPTNGVTLSTGLHTLLVQAELHDTVELRSPVQMYIDIPKLRFALQPGAASVFVSVEQGIKTQRQLQASIRQDDDRITVALLELPQAPWVVVAQMGGQILWKDDEQIRTQAQLTSEPCVGSEYSQPVDIATLPCGSTIREVSLGSRPRIAVKPLAHPYDEVVSLEVESTAETTIAIVMGTLSGEVFHVSERFTLQKGLQHCNFSCSEWASGLYRLVIYQGADIVDRKIIIVN